MGVRWIRYLHFCSDICACTKQSSSGTVSSQVFTTKICTDLKMCTIVYFNFKKNKNLVVTSTVQAALNIGKKLFLFQLGLNILGNTKDRTKAETLHQIYA